MKKLVISIVIFCSLFGTIAAQNNVSNVRVQQSDEQLIITYDLSENADIEVHVSFDGGVTFRGPLQHVLGSVGKDTNQGNDKIIVWNVFREFGDVDYLNTVIKVVANNNAMTSGNYWTRKSDFAGGYRYGAVGFSIGSKGYIGTGKGSKGHLNDFWEYDQVSNSWTRKADFPGGLRAEAVGFSIGNKGYIGTGISADGRQSDFWEYDPISNSWTQKAYFTGGIRKLSTGFSIDNKGYIGTGSAAYEIGDFWEITP